MHEPRNAAGTPSPVERLRALADRHVTVTTCGGVVSGSVLSCSRRSVWLVEADTDFVIDLDDIVDVVVDPPHRAA